MVVSADGRIFSPTSWPSDQRFVCTTASIDSPSVAYVSPHTAEDEETIFRGSFSDRFDDTVRVLYSSRQGVLSYRFLLPGAGNTRMEIHSTTGELLFSHHFGILDMGSHEGMLPAALQDHADMRAVFYGPDGWVCMKDVR